MRKKELIESKETLSFHIDGGYEIDAILLSKIINDMAKLVEYSGKEIDPDIFIKMNVTAFKDGCFQIDFSTVCLAAATLLQSVTSSINVAADTIDLLKTLFRVKTFLKGESPQSVEELNDSIIITNSKNSTLEVSKHAKIVLNNCHIDNFISDISTCTRQHNSDSGFTLESSTGKESFNSEDIFNMSINLPENSIVTRQFQTIKTNLGILIADFSGKRQWEMSYKNERIRVTIEDSKFLDKIHNGKLSITAGDYINCTLEISIELDSEGIQKKDTLKYTVLEVYGDIYHQNCDQITADL